jgi:hypothetical protein
VLNGHDHTYARGHVSEPKEVFDESEEIKTVYVNSANKKNILVQRNVLIYPNPSNGKLYLKSNEDYTYEIFSVTGQKTQIGDIIHGDSMIDLSNYKNGVYFIIFKDDELSFIKKIIIE